MVAVLLMLPSLIWGTLPTHSSLHNLTWAAQFSEQFRAGILYPRWMADSFNGLGAPSFYFYPPFAFWVDAIVSLVTFDLLSTSWRLSLTATLMLWASGAAMYGWLRLEKAEPKLALIGALAYMAAPYHLVDHYIRGAFAEFAAYSVLPLAMGALALVAQRRRFGVPLLALAYAALILSHLPTALLISLTAIPAYVLFVAMRSLDRDRWFLVRAAAGLGLGLSLTALYLLPALTLQDAVLIEWMWVWGFKVEESYLLMPSRWVQSPEMFMIVASISVAWLLACMTLLVFRRTAQVMLWSLLVVAATILMSGLVPWEHVPMVSKVGFAWRLLIVVEFAAITALCLAAWPVRHANARRLFWLAVIALAPALVGLWRSVVDRIDYLVTGQPNPIQDAREYLPAGYPQPPGSSYAVLGLEPTEDLPMIACAPAARVCRAEAGRFGAMHIEIESDQPTTASLRRFAFPAWQLDPPLPLTATAPLRQVSFVAPAGRQSYSLRRQILPAERWGGLVSSVALAGLAISAFVSRRR